MLQFGTSFQRKMLNDQYFVKAEIVFRDLHWLVFHIFLNSQYSHTIAGNHAQDSALNHQLNPKKSPHKQQPTLHAQSHNRRHANHPNRARTSLQSNQRQLLVNVTHYRPRTSLDYRTRSIAPSLSASVIQRDIRLDRAPWRPWESQRRRCNPPRGYCHRWQRHALHAARVRNESVGN